MMKYALYDYVPKRRLERASFYEQLLHYNADQIKALAKDVLEGNMREIIG